MTIFNVEDETRDTFLDMIRKTKSRERITLLCVDKKNNISNGKPYTIGIRGTNKDPKNTCKKGTKRIGFFHTHPSADDPNMKNFSYGDLVTGLNKNVKIMCLGYKPDKLKCVVRKSDKNLKNKLDKHFENYNKINGSSEKFLKGQTPKNSYKEDKKAAKKLLKDEFDFFKLM